MASLARILPEINRVANINRHVDAFIFYPLVVGLFITSDSNAERMPTVLVWY